ncbi:MAG TPA: hypothetical protein V6C69_20110 [Trichormus sp.]|jgi:hypothetical protein
MSDLSNPHNKVVFFHIPKTGGITFRSVLQSIYGNSFFNTVDPSTAAMRASLEKYECIEIHCNPYQGVPNMNLCLVQERRWDLLTGTNIFTMFRDPVDQAISLYCDLARQITHLEQHLGHLKYILPPFPRNLEEFAAAPWFGNAQINFLLATQELWPRLGPAHVHAVKNWLVDLQVHVGVTERFADSLQIFESVSGRRVPDGKVLFANTNKQRPPLDSVPESVKRKLRNNNAIDMELYEFGRQLFENDLRKYGTNRTYTFFSSVDEPQPEHCIPPEIYCAKSTVIRKLHLLVRAAIFRGITLRRRIDSQRSVTELMRVSKEHDAETNLSRERSTV